MLYKICGPCAINQKMDLNARYALAIERSRGVKYICGVCHKEHRLDVIQQQVQEEVEETVPAAPKVSQTVIKKVVPVSKPMQEVEQIKFFI
ncbi:hypothetical protein [Paenibacillus agricola]|uniref:Uncharacterized protein n=1 Tax=Paenibacillus agricola TaxID=2716264 RepID=A0ABX0JG69_9BACL|nr:hypothetical protein [Paenibacillus agricola]NHN35555.1 hypothetical protein [Paenibacillus agricola]